jgi:hypothetical protein
MAQPSLLILTESTPTNWGDVATWVTGIATIALFVIAFIQIRTERQARIKRERDSESKAQREQAELISSWIVLETDVVWVAILNQSPQPVYQMIVSIFAIGQSGDHLRGEIPAGQVCVGVVPPGQGYVGLLAPYQGMFRRPGVEIAFRDKAGMNWIRKPWGELAEIGMDTLEYYQVDLPARWEGLCSELPEGKDLWLQRDESHTVAEDEPPAPD